MDLQDKTALVTGSTEGWGALSPLWLSKGARGVVHGRDGLNQVGLFDWAFADTPFSYQQCSSSPEALAHVGKENHQWRRPRSSLPLIPHKQRYSRQLASTLRANRRPEQVQQNSY